jgi:hypothetical protein
VVGSASRPWVSTAFPMRSRRATSGSSGATWYSGGSISVSERTCAGARVAAITVPSTPYECATMCGRAPSSEAMSAASTSKSWRPAGGGGLGG